jgi:hypothetical protein
MSDERRCPKCGYKIIVGEGLDAEAIFRAHVYECVLSFEREELIVNLLGEATAKLAQVSTAMLGQPRFKFAEQARGTISRAENILGGVTRMLVSELEALGWTCADIASQAKAPGDKTVDDLAQEAAEHLHHELDELVRRGFEEPAWAIVLCGNKNRTVFRSSHLPVGASEFPTVLRKIAEAIEGSRPDGVITPDSPKGPGDIQ